MLTRREFILRGLAGAGGAVLLGVGGREALAETLQPLNRKQFPYLEVSGTPHEIGKAIGVRFGDNIRKGLKRRAEWFQELRAYALGEGKKHYAYMLKMSEAHTPGPLEELHGWAEGSGVPFEDLFVLNCKSEFDTFMQMGKGCPGCSVVAFRSEDNLIVAHNEDGHKAYEDLMFMLRVKPKGGTEFVAFTYPGIMEGNAPGVNEHGITFTTNYIPSAKVKPGVPRYFLDRMALEAKTVDEVVEIVSHPERGYAYHHVITSLKERRAVALEAAPWNLETKKIDGLYWHTNHLIFPTMKELPQFEKYMKISSIPRYESLTKSLGGKRNATKEEILAALSNHDGRPWSVCRHPEGDAEGATLGTVVFTSPGPEVAPGDYQLQLYNNNPCGRNVTVYGV